MSKAPENKSAVADHDYLRWLIVSRKRNQDASLFLLELIDKYDLKIKSRKGTNHSISVERLTAVCFSLWRAAFLADRKSMRDDILKHARGFLLRMVEDNAIAYQQDKDSREWTFNYYINTARAHLKSQCLGNQKVLDFLAISNSGEGDFRSRARWDRYQSALEVALQDFEKTLKAK